MPGFVAAQLSVGGALVRILKRFVGLPDFLDFFFGIGFLGNVRVILVRELAVCLLDLLGAGVSRNAQNVVIVLVFHRMYPDECEKLVLYD